MTARTRRAALGAILAAPLASVPAAATVAAPRSSVPPVSRKLARLIAKHDRINAILNAESDDCNPARRGTARAAGAIRARVTAFPSASFADILAKAACLARLWPLSDAEGEVQSKAASGHVYMDDMALNIAMEVMKLGEGMLCA